MVQTESGLEAVAREDKANNLALIGVALMVAAIHLLTNGAVGVSSG